MAPLDNFMYFENSKIGINLEDVSEFRIQPLRQSDGKTVEGLVFYKRLGERTVILDRYDIANFEQNHL